jgi:hypothetical protein
LPFARAPNKDRCPEQTNKKERKPKNACRNGEVLVGESGIGGWLIDQSTLLNAGIEPKRKKSIHNKNKEMRGKK